MATFKICLRRPRKDGVFQVFIRITHNRVARYINTEKLVTKKQIRKGEIKDPAILSYCSNLIKEYCNKLNSVEIADWNTNDIVSFLLQADKDISFSDYARKYTIRMITEWGMARNARNYKWAYQSLESFSGKKSLMFSHLTVKLLQDWIKSLEHTHRAKEMYPICVRMMFEAALDEFNDEDRGIIRIKGNPFRKIRIPKADTPEKRALDICTLRNFFSGTVPESKIKEPMPELSRDVAEMVFCLAGMNTADLFELRKENLKNGVLCYQRQKTKKFRTDGAYIEIRIPDRILPLFEKYKSDNEYLLSFNKRFQDSNCFNINTNKALKVYCRYNELPDICIYNFRHSWATIAQNNCGATTEQVGFALNHSSAHRITEGYIKKDYSPISILNEKVISCVFDEQSD